MFCGARANIYGCVHHTRNHVRGRGGQIGRGQWGSECMLGAGLCSLCQLRAREGRAGGGGGLQEQTLWKNSTGGGRGHATSSEGTVLKREVVNPV